MREKHNILFKCAEHAPKPDPQYANKPLKWFVGKFCKLPFPARNEGKEILEHMWVKVQRAEPTSVEADELRGVLYNDPVYETEYEYGDDVLFSRKEIEEVIGEASE